MKVFYQKNKLLLIMVVLTIITIIINQFPAFIESFYSVGIYPYISRCMRFLLGWLPFSIGDIMYGVAAIWLILKIVLFFVRLRRGQLANGQWKKTIQKTAIIAMVIYVLFNWMWAFNYNRLGSAYQFQLKLAQYSQNDLQQFADTLQSRLALVCKDSIALQQNKKNNIPNIKLECENDYALAEKAYPFISYKTLSVKRATLGNVGNYLGFFGLCKPHFAGSATKSKHSRFFCAVCVLPRNGTSNWLRQRKRSELNWLHDLQTIGPTSI
jgi:hypothetical protein